jgi:hypothetical protein
MKEAVEMGVGVVPFIKNVGSTVPKLIGKRVNRYAHELDSNSCVENLEELKQESPEVLNVHRGKQTKHKDKQIFVKV